MCKIFAFVIFFLYICGLIICLSACALVCRFGIDVPVCEFGPHSCLRGLRALVAERKMKQRNIGYYDIE